MHLPRSYVGEVLDGAGITDTTAQLIVNIVLNVFNFLCAIGGSFAMERIGRKRMLRKSSPIISL
jgi:uncharacterized membrane protein (UPF0182 family)